MLALNIVSTAVRIDIKHCRSFIFLREYFVFSARKIPGSYLSKYVTMMTVCTPCNHVLTYDAYFVDKHIKAKQSGYFLSKLAQANTCFSEFLTDEKLQPG